MKKELAIGLATITTAAGAAPAAEAHDPINANRAKHAQVSKHIGAKTIEAKHHKTKIHHNKYSYPKWALNFKRNQYLANVKAVGTPPSYEESSANHEVVAQMNVIAGKDADGNPVADPRFVDIDRGGTFTVRLGIGASNGSRAIPGAQIHVTDTLPIGQSFNVNTLPAGATVTTNEHNRQVGSWTVGGELPAYDGTEVHYANQDYEVNVAPGTVCMTGYRNDAVISVEGGNTTETISYTAPKPEQMNDGRPCLDEVPAQPYHG
jgi:hypothetical protein